MVARTLEEQIAAAEKRVQQLKRRKEAASERALQRMIRGKRSDDTRRKILVGAAILARVDRGEWPREQLLVLLDEFLERDDDRALFSLPPRKSSEG
jgi:hypothetical protein